VTSLKLKKKAQEILKSVTKDDKSKKGDAQPGDKGGYTYDTFNTSIHFENLARATENVASTTIALMKKKKASSEKVAAAEKQMADWKAHLPETKRKYLELFPGKDEPADMEQHFINVLKNADATDALAVANSDAFRGISEKVDLTLIPPRVQPMEVAMTKWKNSTKQSASA